MNSSKQHDYNRNPKDQGYSFNVVEVKSEEDSTIQGVQSTLLNNYGSLGNHDLARSQFLINNSINDPNIYGLLNQYLTPVMNQTNSNVNINHSANPYPQQFTFNTPWFMQTQIPMQNQSPSLQTTQSSNNNLNNFVVSNELNRKINTTEQLQAKRKIVTAKKTGKKPSSNSNQNSSTQQSASIQGNSTATINMQLMEQNQNNNINTQKEFSITQASNNHLRKILFSLKLTDDRQAFEQLFNSNIYIKKWLLGEFNIDDPAFGEFRTGELFMNALNLRVNTEDLFCWLSTNKKFTENQFSNIDAKDPGSSYFRAKLSQYIGGFAKQVLQESDKRFLQYLIILLHNTKFIKDLLDAFLAKSSSSEISEEYRVGLLNVYSIIQQANDVANCAIANENPALDLTQVQSEKASQVENPPSLTFSTTPFNHETKENGKDESNTVFGYNRTYSKS